MQETRLSLYMDSGNQESYVAGSYWPALNTTNYDFDLIAGTYYLHVESSNYYNESYLGTYSFTTSFKSAGESFAEPNDSYSNASPITMGSTVKGQLAVNDEYDVYAFTLNTSGRMTLTYTTSQIEETYLYLYQDDNNSEKYINSYYPALNTTTYVYDLAPGKYYIHVERYSSDLKHEGSYSFKTSFAASGEKYTGPNNTYSAASPISFNQTVKGHLGINDSVDVYALTLSSKKTVNLTFSTSQLERADIRVYVDNNNTESYKTSATLNKGTTTLALKDYPAGKYYIHVERFNSYAENLGTYSIRAEGAGGWMKSNGKWWYQYGNGGYPRNKWEQIGGKWYHFDSQGYMETGWKKINNVWYYMDGSGAMVTGWKSISGTWYYFKSSGAMVTGWQKINNVWYYFNASGAMQTGWKKISNTWYYFSGSGAMQTGWLKVGGIWYYFESSGAMVTGSRKIGNKTYRFNSNGECLNP